ncbi:MAG: hypothetical protein KM310_00690, partial [Clostridiales bacterium]|nr:hypothetical protein [Clostridiales bacterium]
MDQIFVTQSDAFWGPVYVYWTANGVRELTWADGKPSPEAEERRDFPPFPGLKEALLNGESFLGP